MLFAYDSSFCFVFILTVFPQSISNNDGSTDPSTTYQAPSASTCPKEKYGNYTFNETRRGSWCAPLEMRNVEIEDNGSSRTTLVRYCLLNGTWATPRSYPISATSSKLYNVLMSKNPTHSLFFANFSTFYNKARLSTIDIHFISSILEEAIGQINKQNEEYFVSTIDNLLWLDKYHMTVAQQHFNATDRILNSLNLYLIFDNSTKDFVKTKFTVQTIHAESNSELMAAWLVRTENRRFLFEPLDEDDDPVDVMEKSDVIALFQVFRSRKYELKNVYFFAIFFESDTLFTRDYTDLRHPTPIISISFPDINIKKRYGIVTTIFYKDSQCNFNRTCDYWNYGNSGPRHLQGMWQANGKAVTNPRCNIFNCNYTRGSHFAMVRLFKYGRECTEEIISDLNLTFPATPAGTWGIPLELCLQDDYTPVRRPCYHNAKWGPISGTCSRTVSITSTTTKLYQLLKEETGDMAPVDYDLDEINYNITEVRAIDVHFLSKIVDAVGKKLNDDAKVPSFLKNIANMMAINRTTLRNAQISLNSTDRILYAIDRFLLRTNTTSNYLLSNLSIQTIDLTNDQIGVMIKNSNHFQPLYAGNYSQVLQSTDYTIAFRTLLTDRTYYVTFYNNDHFFNEENTTATKPVNSAVIGILSPDQSDNTTHDLEIFFRAVNSSVGSQHCHHWQYGYDNNNAMKGKWHPNSGAVQDRRGYFACRYNHTTHFAMLISDNVPDNSILDLITIVGSVLSAMGLVTIVMTAATFKEWRKNSSNKVILNIAVCLLLEIVLFYVSGEVAAGTICIIIGALLHYLILAQFCWMLVICYCHYRRLVVVFHSYINNALSKYCALCWGLPLLLVTVIIASSPETYDKLPENSNTQICYPKGIYLKLGIIMPISIILTINFVAYIVIIKNLMKQFDSTNRSVTKSYAVHKSVFLMFFMIGITWIFGFVAGFTGSSLFLYLFCTTATCQGFIMSIFYILDSASTRGMWKNKMKDLQNKHQQHSNSSSRVSTVPSISASF